MRVINEQSQSSFDDNYNWISYYNWTGTPGKSFSPRVPNGGNNEPKKYTGMVGTHHRPSDDLSIYRELWFIRSVPISHSDPAFLVPANAMLSVELNEIASVLDSAKQARNVSAMAKEWSKRIKKAIYDTAVSSP
jgi:meiotically up-regulated gene 157 (Mug157) protein